MLEEVYTAVKKNARDYLPIDRIEDFIQRVSRWEPQIQSWFYQITQSGDEAMLEFGACLERGLLDIIVGPKQVATTLVPFRSVTSARIREEPGQVTLDVSTAGQVQLSYQATQDASRQDLKDYFGVLEKILARQPEKG